MSQMPKFGACTEIADFDLIRPLGSGGMGEVWLARRKGARTVAHVAIKVMASHICDSPAHLRLFEAEARLSMLLNHSNIVQVFDLCRFGDRRGLVMEWVDGISLEQLLQSMRRKAAVLPFDVVAFVLGELLKALVYAHEHGDRAIVHRDISPHNLLLSASGQVKLADFGIARVSSDSCSGDHVRGKLRYMAPEQASGASSKPTIDLFAVGAILHELLEGVRFRDSIPAEELFAAVLAGDVPVPTRADVPSVLAELRDGLLHPMPANRIRTAAAALAKLREWPGYRNVSPKLARLVHEATGEAASDPTDPRGKPSARPRSRSIFPQVALASLLSLGIGVGLARCDQQPPNAAAAKHVSALTTGTVRHVEQARPRAFDSRAVGIDSRDSETTHARTSDAAALLTTATSERKR